MLRVEGLRKSYSTPQGRIAVLRGVDVTLAAGASLALTGESGSGKSTLLHLVGALDDADSGAVVLDGVALTLLSEHARAAVRREKIGVVFQQFNLIPSLTVAENLGFQARLAGRYDSAWQEEVADRLGLANSLRAIRRSCRADSSSASRLAARWPCARSFCSPTSRPAISMKRQATM